MIPNQYNRLHVLRSVLYTNVEKFLCVCVWMKCACERRQGFDVGGKIGVQGPGSQSVSAGETRLGVVVW